MRRKPDDDQLRRGVDVDSLSVDAACTERSVAVMRDPPHCVIAPPRQSFISRFRKHAPVAATANVVDDGGWQNRLTVVPTAQTYHLSESCHVTERQIQPAAGISIPAESTVK
jgi:hypothetical protein